MEEPGTDTLIPRRVAKERIQAAGFPRPSDYQIDRWDDAGLLCEPPCEGRRERYGYTEAQVLRLILIAQIVASIGSKRVRSSEIAFWLCILGARDVPPELVCKHLEATVRTYQKALRRILNGLGRRNEGHHIGGMATAMKLGGLMAKFVVLKLLPSFGRTGFARDLIGTAIGLFLRSSAKPLRYHEAANDLRNITTALRPNSEPPRDGTLREVAAMIADASQLFRLDDENTMLKAVRSLASAPADVFEVVENGRNALAVSRSVFPWIIDTKQLPSLSVADRRIFARLFPPLICGVMASLRHDAEANVIAAELRAGNTERVLSELSHVKQLSKEIVNTISLEAVRNEQH